MTAITEAKVEQIALDLLKGLGWGIIYGSDIAPDTDDAKRANYGRIVLRHDPQLNIEFSSSSSYRDVFPNKQILRNYAENRAILCPSANCESSLRRRSGLHKLPASPAGAVPHV